jgi:hypothetical protein
MSTETKLFFQYYVNYVREYESFVNKHAKVADTERCLLSLALCSSSLEAETQSIDYCQ